jgi:hypothetical protein
MKKIYTCIISIFLLLNLADAQVPTIASFSPSSGSIGTLVTIIGNNLNNIDTIKIGGVSAIKISSTDTNLVAMVMPNAVSDIIFISNNSGSTNSIGIFTVYNDYSTFSQQGNKLFGSGSVGASRQGISVAISSDGNTSIVGGLFDNNNQGAVWIFIKVNGVWSQQGNKLVGTGAIGENVYQGSSVGISADGNTVIIGAYGDNSGTGAVWIFKRNGTIWSQQGNKLVGTGSIGFARQGISVSMSGDGNTAIIGGHTDNSNIGAFWIFKKTGGLWSQQGNKLVGFGNSGTSLQGCSVSLSSDGYTAIIGGYGDNSNQGASWIFSNINGIWVQQGNKLVGTSNIGEALQGVSVGISADGNTVAIGGRNDNNSIGAVWIFVRNEGLWVQQGSKLVGIGNVGAAYQGGAVSLSADGNTLLVGGGIDNNIQGAFWLFIRNLSNWNQQGNKIVGTGNTGIAGQGISASISNDGKTIIVGAPRDSNDMGAMWVFTKSKISIIGSVKTFEKCLGFNSNAQSISITGVDILSNLTIAAPTGFEISRNQFTNYSSNIVLNPLNRIIDTTIIYIRLTTLVSGNILGNIICSNNESTINIPVIGTSTIKTRTFIKDFNSIQCLKNNVFPFKDSTIYCGNINRKWFINNILHSTDSSFQYSFTNTGTYAVKLLVTNINGEKDSVTKIVTVNPSPNLSITATQTSVCKSQGESVKLSGSGALNYTWTNGVVNDVFFVPDTTKNYQFIGYNSYGCFDTANITIAVNPMPIIITTLDKTKITSFQFGASFQWYDCDLKTLILGETKQTFTATKNGNYAVIINLNSCIDTSECVSVLSVGNEEIENELNYSIYPNPNNGSFKIKLNNNSSKASKITIIDMFGRIVHESEIDSKLNTDFIYVPQINLVNGIYTLILKSTYGISSRKPLLIQNNN